MPAALGALEEAHPGPTGDSTSRRLLVGHGRRGIGWFAWLAGGVAQAPSRSCRRSWARRSSPTGRSLWVFLGLAGAGECLRPSTLG